MKRWAHASVLIIAGAVALLPALAIAQGTAPPAGGPDSEAFKAFNEYRKFVTEENKAFIDFLKLTVGGAVVVATAFFGFMNWRTASEVRATADAELAKAVEAQLGRVVAKTLDEREAEIRRAIASDIDKRIAAQRADMEAALKQLDDDLAKRREYINKLLYEVSQGVTGQKAPNAAAEAANPADAEDGVFRGKTILWVDDVPGNNQNQSQTLQDLGARIDSVLSTASAMKRLEQPQHYNVIITDMGRAGEGSRAGLDLLEKVTAAGIALPVVFFCSNRQVRMNGDEAIEKGAYAVTSSNTALFRALTGALRKDPPMGIVAS